MIMLTNEEKKTATIAPNNINTSATRITTPATKSH
jgi:hypothetical protein